MPAETNLQSGVPSSAGAAPAAAPSAPPVTAPASSAADSADLSTMFSAAQAAGGQAEPPASPSSGQTSGQPAASAAPQVSALAAQAAELGIELPATASDADVANALMAQYQQMRPMAQYAQSLLPHADAINQFFAQRGQAPQPPAAPANAPEQWSLDGHFAKHWDGPKLTPEMQFAINQGMVVRDAETGLMVAKPGMELMVAPILQGLNQALNWQSEAARGFITDPYRKTYEVLQDPIQRLIDERVARHLQAMQAQQQQVFSQQTAADSVNQFELANKDWMYQPANNGGFLLTPKGTQFVKLVKDMAANYTGDSATLLNLCKQAVLGPDVPASTPGAPAAPASAPAAATSLAPTPSQVSQAQKSSFLQNAIANAAHQPSGGANTVQSPTGPVSVTPMELESMFVSDFRAQSVAA